MRIMIFFKDTKNLVTITLKQLAADCGSDYTEFEVIQVLNEMRQRNEIEYKKLSNKKIAV